MRDESAIYEDHILRHYEEPYHNARFPNATHRQPIDNPVCGDSVEIELRVSDTGTIEQAWFTGTGCVISQASASMLVEHIESQSLEALSTFTAQDMLHLFRARLTPHCAGPANFDNRSEGWIGEKDRVQGSERRRRERASYARIIFDNLRRRYNERRTKPEDQSDA